MAIHVDTPAPLDSCPGRDRWEGFRGEPYFVFVDESFNRFFELDSRFGYFCHAALGIPQSRYEAVRRLIQPVFNDYQQLTSLRATEFKHADFKRIAFTHRLGLATRLAATLRDNGAIVGAFYTPTASYILEKARWILVGEADALPDDMAALFAQASAQLREGDPGPGKAHLISNLLHLPLVALLNLFESFDCSYEAYYDPRERREDHAVADSVQGFINAHSSKQRHLLVGIRVDRSSEQEVGLQLADLMVGEVRLFFDDYPALMSHGATRNLITPWSDEPIQTVVPSEYGPLKTGVISTLPEELLQAFGRCSPERSSLFPCFADMLASGILTCYSSTGTPRDIFPFLGQVWDQADLDILTLLMSRAQARRDGEK